MKNRLRNITRLWQRNSGINGIKEGIVQNALIIDVRSPAEFATGHIPGARNIALDQISYITREIKNLHMPVIACCRSGVHSDIAVELLKSAGVEAYNGGPWQELEKKICKTR